MNYTVELKPRAIKDLKNLQRQDASRITDALEDIKYLRIAKAEEATASIASLASVRKELKI